MADVTPVDFTSNVGRVRKYIPDLNQLPDPRDPAGPVSYIFSDAEIQSFIDDEVPVTVPATPAKAWHLRRAAAWAMIAIANSENLILKKIVTEDQETDGPAVAKALLASAQELFKRAEIEEVAQAETQSFIAVDYVHAPPRYQPLSGPFRGFY